MDPKHAIELGKKHAAVMVDLKFIDSDRQVAAHLGAVPPA